MLFSENSFSFSLAFSSSLRNEISAKINIIISRVRKHGSSFEDLKRISSNFQIHKIAVILTAISYSGPYKGPSRINDAYFSSHSGNTEATKLFPVQNFTPEGGTFLVWTEKSLSLLNARLERFSHFPRHFFGHGDRT